MDIAMPFMDGLTATKLIRADPALRDIPVIACTAQASLLTGEQRLFFAVTTKPVDYRELLRLLNAAVRSRSR
jgi:CheY-like chemotaxis protein